MAIVRLFSVVLLMIVVSSFLVNAQAQARQPQASNHDKLAKEFDSLLQRMRAMEKELLAVSEQDRAAHAKFLEQPETGLIRLLPREKYDGKLEVRGGGAYYSFQKLTHAYGYGSDIELNSGGFRTGFAGSGYGFLAVLGDIPLEAVTLHHPTAKYPAEYQAARTPQEANAARQRSQTGFQEGETVFKINVLAHTGTTYLLRSIDYENSDLLIAFRVLRKDADGSVVLLWKALKSFPIFPLARN